MNAEPSLTTRRLGSAGPLVSTMGLGCMGMSAFYGAPDASQAQATLRRAVELGVNFFDTASVYGDGHNERLLGKSLAPVRESVVLATKFGMTRVDAGTFTMDGRPETARASCDDSLRRLGTDVIDVFYAHRVDPRVPIEETVGAMSELVDEGKVRHLGLCEASSRSLERAHAVHPIAALQSEWSLWTRDIEGDTLATARRLGIGIVPYCPLGRGFLTGTVTDSSQFETGDLRLTSPRFAAENLARNMTLVHGLEAVAAEKECTTAQLALAWVLAQGEDVIPIPGTKRIPYLEQNVAATRVELTRDDLEILEHLAPPGVAAGARYGPAMSFGDSPDPTTHHRKEES